MWKLHCLAWKYRAFVGNEKTSHPNPHTKQTNKPKRSQRSQWFCSLQSWGSQTSNFLFLALSGLKRSWPGPIKTCSKKVRSSNGASTGVFGSSKWWEFPCPFSGCILFFAIRWANPRVCGWKVMICIGPNQIKGIDGLSTVIGCGVDPINMCSKPTNCN